MRACLKMKRYLPFAAVCFFSTPALCLAAEPVRSMQPPGWDAGLKLQTALDTNADPRVVEINLEARLASVEIVPGHPTEAWTYDGGLPGPLIRARVGDRLVVHFVNHLPQPTTVHWHGVRVPIQMDGVPEISQPEVKPGESFTYDFVVPDAGLFWYHPHVMSAAQVGFGLYGALLVEDPSEQIGVADELVLVLSDIEISPRGNLEPADSGGVAGMVFGREGNHVLVNGRERPVLKARAGATQRWRIVNTAKSRYFSIDAGDSTTYTLIGGDGGLQEYPTRTDLIVLGPGERADVIVTPHAKPGSDVVVRSLLFDRGYGSTEYRDVPDLFTMTMAAEPAVEAPPLPAIHRTIEPLTRAGATDVPIRLTLTQRNRTSEFGIDGRAYPNAPHVAAAPGETQLWTVVNQTKWAHPLHLHGFFFQVLDEKGEPIRPLAWKDTVHVPAERTVRLLVRFDDREGEWMYHCHILDHADGGLMSTVLLGGVKPSAHTHSRR